MDLRSLAIVVWRIIGTVFLIYAAATVIVQFGAVSGTFGQIMDGESLYTGSTLFAIFLWPTILSVVGVAVIATSRALAGFVVRGVDSDDR
jgi:uncharacterized membrane protein